jgi:hypothetical protein
VVVGTLYPLRSSLKVKRQKTTHDASGSKRSANKSLSSKGPIDTSTTTTYSNMLPGRCIGNTVVEYKSWSSHLKAPKSVSVGITLNIVVLSVNGSFSLKD